MGFFLFSGSAAALPASTPEPLPVLPSYTVALTAYNAVPGQTDDDPLTTASGAYANPEIIMARSQDLADELPFGTIVELEGPSVLGNTCGYRIVAPLIGYRVIADTMNARYTNRLDVLFSTKSNYTLANGSTKNASTILGICGGITARVVGHIESKNPRRLPKTQAELAALVEGKDKQIALKQ